VPLRIHDEKLSRRVGAVVLVVTAAVVIYVVGVRERFPSTGIDVRVYFSQPTGIREGAAVRIAGRDIGVLTSISIVPAQRTWRGHPLEGTGGVVVVARIDRAWAARIPANAEFFVGSRSILAPRYLEIAAPRDHAPARPLAAGDEIRGIDPPDLDRILQRVWDQLTGIDEFMDSVNPSAAVLRFRIARLTWTISRVVPTIDGSPLRDAVAEARTFAASLDPAALAGLATHARAVVDRATAVVADLRGQVDALRASISDAAACVPPGLRTKIEQAIASIDPVLRDTDQLLANVQAVLGDATTGDGSIAAFGRDLELFDDIKAMTKMMKRNPWRVVVPSGR